MANFLEIQDSKILETIATSDRYVAQCYVPFGNEKQAKNTRWK